MSYHEYAASQHVAGSIVYLLVCSELRQLQEFKTFQQLTTHTEVSYNRPLCPICHIASALSLFSTATAWAQANDSSNIKFICFRYDKNCGRRILRHTAMSV